MAKKDRANMQLKIRLIARETEKRRSFVDQLVIDYKSNAACLFCVETAINAFHLQFTICQFATKLLQVVHTETEEIVTRVY